MKFESTTISKINKESYKRMTKYTKIYDAIQKTKTPLKVSCKDEKEMRSLGYSISQRFHRVPEFRKCYLTFSRKHAVLYILPVDLADDETIK